MSPNEWNEFVAKHGPESGRFLQSWEWGEMQGVQRKTGGDIGRQEETEEDKGGQKWVANVFVKKLPIFGSYIYCPRGPITESSYQVAAEEITHKNIMFARFDVPLSQIVSQNKCNIIHSGGCIMLHDKNWIKAIDISPSITWITDLDKSEDELFAKIHKKTRYNIKLAERHKLRVEIHSHDFEKVWHLFELTSTRGEFRLHKKSYYKKMLRCAFLAVVWKDDEPIAANIMIDFAGVRTYLHGASSHKHRALMAPHLLHWELIKDAKQKGLQKYDWWGVAPLDEPNHPWAGIGRFKRSFPGREVVYAGTYDFVIKPFWYNVYRLARKLRRIDITL